MGQQVPQDEMTINEGDLIELIGRGNLHQILKIQPDDEIHTHKGVVRTNDIIGKLWGSIIQSHNGNQFYIVQPALTDLIKNLPRNTQILYPKDVGFVLLNLAIGPGKRVIEAGTGSGALTTALAYAVGLSGRVYSYDNREDLQRTAIKNLDRVGLNDQVDYHVRNIEEGFIERNVDALFLDVPNAYDYLEQARAALKPGGFFGSLLPTMNQVTLLLDSLKKNTFGFIEVCEIMIRYYRIDANRFRPSDRMVGHTGFLIFARPLAQHDPELAETPEPDDI